MPKPPIQREGAAADALRHLAENGPTPTAEIRELMLVGKAGKHSAEHAAQTVRRLEDLGLIKTRILLTPKGLEELHRMGWKPQLEGIAP